jgi:hypothetical protein
LPDDACQWLDPGAFVKDWKKCLQVERLCKHFSNLFCIYSQHFREAKAAS